MKINIFVFKGDLNGKIVVVHFFFLSGIYQVYVQRIAVPCLLFELYPMLLNQTDQDSHCLLL